LAENLTVNNAKHLCKILESPTRRHSKHLFVAANRVQVLARSNMQKAGTKSGSFQSETKH